MTGWIEGGVDARNRLQERGDVVEIIEMIEENMNKANFQCEQRNFVQFRESLVGMDGMRQRAGVYLGRQGASFVFFTGR